ncbi:MAG: adenylate/guanylate cyclase domain-containing protein [Archangiaceae bacterium]|nr:adenylate/guanylate cyclase domain-containing protein [Archangiaceae bacterium]
MSWLARRRYEVLALVVGLLAATVHRMTVVPKVGLANLDIGPLERAVQLAEGRITDLKFRFRGPVAPHPDVVVVAIDEKSVQAWGLWPWSRRHMAEAFERLAEANVKSVGMDVTFTDARDEGEATAKASLAKLAAAPTLSPELEQWKRSLEASLQDTADGALEAGLRRLGPRMVQGFIPIENSSSSDFTPEQLTRFNTLIEPIVIRGFTRGQGIEVQLPIEKLELWTAETGQMPLERFLATGTRYGHFAMVPDLDGTIRRMAIWGKLRGPKGLVPSMALETAAVALGGTLRPIFVEGQVVGAEIVGPSPRKVPFEELAPFTLIDYVGPGRTFPTYSIADVATGKVGKAELEGKAVLIGVTVVGSSGDQRVTPFKELEPGVFTHASLVSNVLADRFLVRPYDVVLIEMLMVVALALLLGLAIPRVRFALKGVIIAGVASAWVAVSYVAFLQGVQVAVAAPVAGLLVTSFGVVFLGYLSVDREKLKMKSTFSRYLGEDVIEIAIENPERLNKGEKRDMTVLFSDIRGFTTLSERMSPEALASFINEYLSPMTAIVFEEKGTLDKYIGDALMAFWNAPLDVADHPLRACRAAVKMLEKLDSLKKTWREQGLPELEIGVGVNTGPMVVGNMGSDVRVDYTVLGDAVNLGSRLEGTNKEYDTRIIISEFTYQHVKNDVVCRRLGAVRVKGKRLPVAIYELRGIGKPSASEGPVIALFEEALALFTTRKFEEAGVKFREVLQAWPTDMSTRRYLAQIETFKAQPPPNDWDGVASLTTK